MDGIVEALWRYPVKSLQGTACSALTLRGDGVEGDRAWALVEDGRALSAKRVPELLLAGATWEGEEVVLTLPSGERIRGGDPDAAARVSRWLGRTVEVVPRTRNRWVDDAPVHVLSTGGLDALRERHGGDWDPRRFRPNLVLATGDGAQVEDGWLGRQVRVGSAVLEIRKQTIRCAMTTHAQPGLGRDRRVLDTLAADRDACLGVYADVAAPGVVHVGDPVELR